MKKYLSGKNITIAVLAMAVIFLTIKVLGLNNDVKVEVESKREVKINYDTIGVIIEDLISKLPKPTHTTKTIRIPYKVSNEDLSTLREQINSLTEANNDLISNQKIDLDSISIDLPINEYKDTLKVDGATLSYNHKVAGFLERSKYNIQYPKETVTIIDSIFTTKTITRNRIFDFFLVGGYQFEPYREFKVGIDLVTKKWKIGAKTGYDATINQQTFELEAGIKLFGQ